MSIDPLALAQLQLSEAIDELAQDIGSRAHDPAVASAALSRLRQAQAELSRVQGGFSRREALRVTLEVAGSLAIELLMRVLATTNCLKTQIADYCRLCSLAIRFDAFVWRAGYPSPRSPRRLMFLPRSFRSLSAGSVSRASVSYAVSRWCFRSRLESSSPRRLRWKTSRWPPLPLRSRSADC